MAVYNIKTFNGSGYSHAAINFSNMGQKIRLTYESEHIKMEVEGDFPFVALAEIRQVLEKDGISLLCNGSRLDVYPSGMFLPSLKAYELKMGQQATILLNIFDPVEDIKKIATVSEQKIYWKKWIESVRNRKE